MTGNPYPPTPELDKMIAARDNDNGLIEHFLDWLLDGQGYTIVRFDDAGENPVAMYDRGRLIGQFYDIDSNKAEDERRAVLHWVREQNDANA